jgi:tRNA threonylcarbamoyladenosine biosynthesis protein TsaE
MKQVNRVKTSKKPADFKLIAREFLESLIKNQKKTGALVVGLRGDLGAGKTTFVQAVARELGIKNKIASPTFVIMKKYALKGRNHKFMFHLDAYRLKNEKELLYLGWEEVISDPEHLVFIEWPENVKKVMPKFAKFIDISHTKKERERVLYLR